MRNRFVLFVRVVLVGALLSCGPARADEVAPRTVGIHAHGRLIQYGEQRVLIVKGTPRQMGLAHGRLLRDEVGDTVRAFLEEWAIARKGRTLDELRAIWKQLAPHIPKRYLEELAGIAEGSGVSLERLQLVHAIPSRYHCTGTAALPAVTADGKVYHTRSLDYSLDIGDSVRPQTNAILYVVVPDEGLPHAIVSWAGFAGCVTGMNQAGVSVGEMGSRSKDESYDGVPMIFLLREVLVRARSLDDAKAIWKKGPRTCGFNFIFCDRDEICAVECTKQSIRFFAPGEAREDEAPHYAIDGIVRRCNHFVDKAMAATQRAVYDPRKSNAGSWEAYRMQGEHLRRARGSIQASTMIEVLRGYPATHPCLHQAVMCPTDGRIWVSHATDPARDPLAGAQNQAFYQYDLNALWKSEPKVATRFGANRRVDPTVETGEVAETRKITGVFAHEPKKFLFQLRPLRTLGKVTISALTYPSPGPSRIPENLTVHAEYFRPPGEGPFPCVVVLHILDGRFYVARLVANTLAQKGIASLFVKLPYYGERRPAQRIKPENVKMQDIMDGMKQSVRDIRRGAAWLRARPEIDAKRVGIVGVSLGSFVAQMAAGADGGFDRCFFLLGGGSITEAVYSGGRDTRKIAAELNRRGWTKKKLAATLAPYEPIHHAKGIAREGVLMVNCREDTVVPPADSRAYWEALGKPRIVWYEGGHYGIKNHVFDVLNLITKHFDR